MAKIKQVTLSLSRKWNTGNYDNVTPGISLVMELEPGEDETEVINQGKEVCRTHVEQMIDTELEKQGDPPHFYAGPRYTLYKSIDDNLAAIIPDALEETSLPGAWSSIYKHFGNRRLEIVQEKAAKLEGYTIIDCSDGDLNKLPPVEKYVYFYHEPNKTVILLLKKDEDKMATIGWEDENRRYKTCLKETMWAFLQETYETYQIIDATDGDISQLPLLQTYRLAMRQDGGKHIILVTFPNTNLSTLPDPWHQTGARRWIRTPATIWQEIEEKYPQSIIIDATDGNFSKIPLTSNEEEDEDDHDEYEDDEDDYDEDYDDDYDEDEDEDDDDLFF